MSSIGKSITIREEESNSRGEVQISYASESHPNDGPLATLDFQTFRSEGYVKISHACPSHRGGGPFGTLESHAFRVQIAIPRMNLTAGLFYTHCVFIGSLVDELVQFASDPNAVVDCYLYPDDIENQFGAFRAHATHLPIDALDRWQCELDGPGETKRWQLRFDLYTLQSDTSRLIKEASDLLEELSDVDFAQVDAL
jgi:hypothetical protein